MLINCFQQNNGHMTLILSIIHTPLHMHYFHIFFIVHISHAEQNTEQNVQDKKAVHGHAWMHACTGVICTDQAAVPVGYPQMAWFIMEITSPGGLQECSTAF